MSIEEVIQANTDALKELTATLKAQGTGTAGAATGEATGKKGRGAAAAATTAAAATQAKVIDPLEEEEDDLKVSPPKTYTSDDVRAALKDLSAGGKRKEAIEIITSVGAESAGKIKPEDFNRVMDAIAKHK